MKTGENDKVLLDDLISRFEKIERLIDTQRMSVDRVNVLVVKGKALHTDINKAIEHMNKSDAAILAKYEKKLLSTLNKFTNLEADHKVRVEIGEKQTNRVVKENKALGLLDPRTRGPRGPSS